MFDTVKSGISPIECMMKTVAKINETAAELMRGAVENGLKTWSGRPCGCSSSASRRRHGVTSDSRIICPPQDECPPRCLTAITRRADKGETIVVPFKVRNNGNLPKTYHVGVRPFIDVDGKRIAQATLDKVKIEAQPGAAVTVEMKVELGQGFVRGSRYETDIVIREKDHNQNICFTLHVNGEEEIPVAAPWDEKDIDTHFHHWYYHYYCENNSLPLIVEEIDRNLDVNMEKAV